MPQVGAKAGRFSLAAGLALALGCGAMGCSDASTESSVADAGLDAANTDITGPDGGDTSAEDVSVGDVGDDDAQTDTTSQDVDDGDTHAGPVLPPLPNVAPLPEAQACPAAPQAQEFATGPGKYAANIFHFNIQYVAGGLDNFLGVYTVGEQEIEDLIIRQSFEPLLELYEKHPTWGVSFEMQGLMLEIMAARHPDVFVRLQTMARRGQADVMSYHWSDQLVTAYPRKHMEWSWAENQHIFEDLCVPRAPVHFLQEGQFGPGVQDFAEQYGELVVLPRNLMKFFHNPPPPGVWYSNLGHKTITTDGANGDGFQLAWTFVDDGELLATGGAAPYLVDAFVKNEKAIATYEAELSALADQGFAHVPLSHYVAQLKAADVPATPIEPPILDGSWQPGNSDLMTIWMGGIGAEPGNERDNEILTGNVVLGQRLRALESLVAAAAWATDAQPDLPAIELVLRHARRELLLAEVSDGTGWRPAGTEVKYALRHAEECRRLVHATARHVLGLMGHTSGTVGVDPTTGAVVELPFVPASETAEPLAGVEVTSTRPYTVTWTHPVGDATTRKLEVHFPATDEVNEGTAVPPAIAIRFPFAGDTITYCPSNQETLLLSVPFDGYAVTKKETEMGLPLPNGLLALGPNQTLLADLSTVHLAAAIGTTPGPEGHPTLTFTDHVQPSHEAVTWRFFIVDSPAAELVDAANSLNVHPVVAFGLEAPAEE